MLRIILGLFILVLGLGTASLAAPLAGAVAAPRVASQLCLNNAVSVQFQWEPSGEGEQWIDLSLMGNGFAPGTFLGQGPLEVDRSALIWDGLLPDRVHFVRVNTLTPGGWQPSGTAVFRTSDCLAPAPAVLQGVAYECEAGNHVTATFYWETANPTGETQWLDLSLYNNDFAPGTFLSAGPLEGGAVSKFAWHGILGNTGHYWRVNTWTGSSWITSATQRFRTYGSLENPDGSCVLVILE